MADKKSAEDPAGKPADPKTLDSFDPLRDAETLLDEESAAQEPTGGVPGRPHRPGTLPDPHAAGQGGADEDDTRFDAG